ncbi:MAG: helix-turn-helix domain-containing protein [Thermoguttaceae bacterium]|jgi:excisionase family DNA binding protein
MIDMKPMSPPAIAKHLGIKADKVLTWIRSGELRAFNVATKQGGRPLWRIKPVDLETFIAKRSTTPPLPKPARSRLPAGVIEFY